MNSIDIILLTLVSTITCLALPRMVSMILALGNQSIKQSRVLVLQKEKQKHKPKVTSFPFCATYTLKTTPSCKFSPHFCERCSPNL
ncbi:hypothetical protein NIES2101_18185 [Calothrix sp. HK-06]|nr:hypothetical protein NIES2101_18185 [Calothrix sp. HK-06]